MARPVRATRGRFPAPGGDMIRIRDRAARESDMPFAEYGRYDALGLAELVRTGR